MATQRSEGLQQTVQKGAQFSMALSCSARTCLLIHASTITLWLADYSESSYDGVLYIHATTYRLIDRDRSLLST